jgi:type IV pilus assembly protein PilX
VGFDTGEVEVNMKSVRVIYIKQRGAVLLVGLILLLMLTVVGLASIRGADLQERMAGNMRDRNVAFQAVEAGLRVGEAKLDLVVLPTFDGNGYWPDLNKTTSPVTSWNATKWASTDAISVSSNYISGLVSPPKYVIEKILVKPAAVNPGSGADQESYDRMGGDVEYYRITSRGYGGTGDSEIILQSTYIR